jgi:hypothetical protein
MVVLCISFLSINFSGCSNVQHHAKLNKGYLPTEDLIIKVTRVVNDTGFTFDIDIEKMLADALEDQLFEKDLLWLGDKEPNLFMESRIIGSSSKLPMTPEEGLTELSIRCELKDDKDNFVGSVIASRKVVIGDLHAVDSWQAVIKSVASDVAEDIKHIAAFSPAKVNPTEPWTGVWEVVGNRQWVGKWALRQSGNKVVSTKESYYEIEGKIDGTSLKGKKLEPKGRYRFELKISPDHLTFEGYASDWMGRSLYFIKGKRKE